MGGYRRATATSLDYVPHVVQFKHEVNIGLRKITTPGDGKLEVFYVAFYRSHPFLHLCVFKE